MLAARSSSFERSEPAAAVKLGSAASSTLGVSGRQLIEATIADQRYAAGLTELAKASLRNRGTPS